jgi:hypothetical protein
LKFFDEINPVDLQRYTSKISSEIEECFNEWISKYLDSRDQSVQSNSKVDDKEDIDEEKDAEEEAGVDKVTKKVKNS